MRILLTGVSGYMGGLLVPRLRADGHELRGFARDPARVPHALSVVRGDAVTGAGLGQALDGIDVAYYLIHSMEPAPPSSGSFKDREVTAAERFAAAAIEAGVSRIIYLGGPVPDGGGASEHLASRLAVERILLAACPGSVALRASIVIGAGSRSFRFLVRLVERLPVLVLPAWRQNRTRPIDERDVVQALAHAATSEEASGLSLDLPGPEVITYGDLVLRIRDLMLLGRPAFGLSRLSATPIASRVSAVLAGEDHELIGPLMEGLQTDLLPRDDRAVTLLRVRRHSLDAAIEHALRDWELIEPLAAR